MGEPGAEHDPGRRLLVATLAPVAVTGVVAVVVSAPAGTPAVVGSLLGTVAAVIAFGLPPLLLTATRNLSPPAVMAVALTGYMTLVGVLGAGYLAVAGADWLSPGHLGWTLFAGTVAACAGLVRGHLRLRVLAFGGDPGSGGPPPPDRRGGQA